MNKKTLIILLLIAITVFLGIKAFGDDGKEARGNSVLSSTATEATQNGENSQPSVVKKEPADKIEVVHFHGTHQCWSCITVGEYALKIIKDKFPEEYASGKIVFKDINGELKENQEIVMKYQARGSSLFVNAIRENKDDIAEDTAVWRLVNNEGPFVSYFENKLNSLLGK